MSHSQPPLAWDTFHGKLPVLQQPSTTQKQDTTSFPPKTSILMQLTDRVGILHDVLKYFWKYDVNISRIESRPKAGGEKFDFFIDCDGSCSDPHLQQLLAALREVAHTLLILDEREVPWFPRHMGELDTIANRILDAGTDLQADHPGFSDPQYRQRREELAQAARKYSMLQPDIEPVPYTEEDTSVWTAVWDRMEPLLEKHACKEYLSALQQMKDHCGYSRDTIPQQAEISKYLQARTNFRMRPVAGLLSSRDFLNGLAFRVFFSTQYIRHSSKPLYTPEPDVSAYLPNCARLLNHTCNRSFMNSLAMLLCLLIAILQISHKRLDLRASGLPTKMWTSWLIVTGIR